MSINIWKELLNVISLELSYQEYTTWISQIRFLSADDRNIRLAVPSKLVKDIVMERYQRLICEKVQDLLGRNISVDISVNTKLVDAVNSSTPRVSGDAGAKRALAASAKEDPRRARLQSVEKQLRKLS